MKIFREKLGSPAARIGAAGALIVILVTVAIGGTVWRFGSSSDRYEQALRSVGVISAISAARTSTFNVDNAVLHYEVTPGADDIADAQRARRQLAADVTRAAATDSSSAPVQLAVDRASTATAALRGAINTLSARHTLAGQRRAVANIRSKLDVVDTSFDLITAAAKARAAQAQSAAQTSGNAARLDGVLVGALALLAVIALVGYSVRLTARLLARMRATAGGLASASSEMRGATREAAAATTQQSAAISEVAVALEELSASATDRRGTRAHQRCRRADEPARAQRGHRGRPRG
jgi:hypothetical protein